MPLTERSFLSRDFALTYESSAEQLTGPFSQAALAMVGDIGPGVRVLDVAAGTGALSVPAAQAGASVLGTDIAPGMIERLAERLELYPKCEARVMNGEALTLPDGSFDNAFSIFGAIVFSDWRKGLGELARAVRKGGQGCVASWRDPPGGGPFVLMAQALRSTFPDQATPPPSEGMWALSSPDTLRHEMRSAGFEGIEIQSIEGTWTAPAGEGFLAATEDLYSYIRPYAQLSDNDRNRVRSRLRELSDEHVAAGRVRLSCTALIAKGQRTHTA